MQRHRSEVTQMLWIRDVPQLVFDCGSAKRALEALGHQDFEQEGKLGDFLSLAALFQDLKTYEQLIKGRIDPFSALNHSHKITEQFGSSLCITDLISF